MIKIKLEMDRYQLKNYIRCIQSENARIKNAITLVENIDLKKHFKKEIDSNNAEINRIFNHISIIKEHEELISLFTGKRLEVELHNFNNKYGGVL